MRTGDRAQKSSVRFYAYARSSGVIPLTPPMVTNGGTAGDTKCVTNGSVHGYQTGSIDALTPVMP